jgi:hypothetical protein
MERIQIVPDAFVNTGLRVTGTVSQDAKFKLVPGFTGGSNAYKQSEHNPTRQQPTVNALHARNSSKPSGRRQHGSP